MVYREVALEGEEKERRAADRGGFSRVWMETAKYICESGSKEVREVRGGVEDGGGTVQLLSRGRDALAVVVTEERGRARPGAVHQ